MGDHSLDTLPLICQPLVQVVGYYFSFSPSALGFGRTSTIQPPPLIEKVPDSIPPLPLYYPPPNDMAATTLIPDVRLSYFEHLNLSLGSPDAIFNAHGRPVLAAAFVQQHWNANSNAFATPRSPTGEHSRRLIRSATSRPRRFARSSVSRATIHG